MLSRKFLKNTSEDMLMRYTYLVVSVAVIAMLGGCMNQGELATLQNRVNQQEQQIQQMSGQLSGVQPAQADTWSQVQSLRQEMAQLKGQIDNLNYATSSVGGVAGLADRVARHDAALRLLESSLSLNLNLDTPATLSPAPGTGVPAAGAGVPPVAPVLGAGQTAAAQPLAQPTPPVRQPAVSQPAQTDVAKALYDAGYKAFTDGKYPQALQSFTDFTTTYPKHNLIGNAWFWKGESNFRLKNYANAALDYEQVITNYPKNQKVPAAYLKQAMSFKEVNKKDVARFRLEDLIKKFPQAPETARAKQLLKEL